MELSTNFCECGCGNLTKLAPQTNKTKGWVINQPLKFVNGHNNKNKRRKLSFETRVRQSKAGNGGKEPTISPFLSRPTILRYIRDRWYGRDCFGKTSSHARLVYLEYKGEIPEKYHIHHINGDSTKIEFDHPGNLLAVPEIWNLMFFTALSKGFDIPETKVTEVYMRHMNQHTDSALFFAVCNELSSSFNHP